MKPAKRFPRHLIAPALLIAGIAAVWVSGVTDALSWSGLARDQTALTGWVTDHPVLAPAAYVLLYIVSVTLSLPQAAILTLTGGLLFGTLAGGAMAILGATIGANFLFLIARSALAGPMTHRGGPALATLRDELARNGFAYLLAIRFIPVVPFWLVNLAAAACGMRLRSFALATLLGIGPTTMILASIGSELRDVLAQGGRPDLGVLVSARVLGPLLALAVLAVAPVIWRKWRSRRRTAAERAVVRRHA